MPLYEYECSACGERFEILQGLGSDSRGLSCPRCGSGELEKALSTFAAGGPQSGASGRSAAAGGCGGGSGFT